MTTETAAPISLQVSDCKFCQEPLASDGTTKVCAKCGSTALERAFATLVRGMLREYDPKTATARVVVGAHRLSSRERALVETLGTCLPATTTTWSEIADAATLTKVLSLPDVASNSVDLFYSPPATLDFASDWPRAIASAARALRASGVLVIGSDPRRRRIVDGAVAPKADVKLDPAAYWIRPPAELWSVVVGRQWVLAALQTCGLKPSAVVVSDGSGGETYEFFLGQKPAA